MMKDLNLVILGGRLAAPAEIRTTDTGTTLVRALITVRGERPRMRIDVIPVTLWDPPKLTLDALKAAAPGSHWIVSGDVQRRFWSDKDGRRSRLEVVASMISPRMEDE